MDFLRIFVFCSLFLQPNGTVSGQQERIPAVQITPFVPTVPAVPTEPTPVDAPPVAVQPNISPATNAKQARFIKGLLSAPKHNHVVLSAPERAKLMSLATEQRDVAGNVMQNSDGNPIIVPIREGMNVFVGQVLGKLDDRELQRNLKINQAQLNVAKAEQEKDIELVHAARGVQVAQVELNVKEESNRRLAGSVPGMEILGARYALAQAEAYLELQKYNINVVAPLKVIVSESELELTNVQIELRQLTAPIDGMIVRVNAAEGEWLREGYEVLEILRLDTLWVTVQASSHEYEHSDLDGKPAMIQVPLPNGRRETFQGTVVFCDPRVNSGGSFEVHIEVPNRRVGNYWLLQPGRGDADVTIQL